MSPSPSPSAWTICDLDIGQRARSRVAIRRASSIFFIRRPRPSRYQARLDPVTAGQASHQRRASSAANHWLDPPTHGAEHSDGSDKQTRPRPVGESCLERFLAASAAVNVTVVTDPALAGPLILPGARAFSRCSGPAGKRDRRAAEFREALSSRNNIVHGGRALINCASSSASASVARRLIDHPRLADRTATASTAARPGYGAGHALFQRLADVERMSPLASCIRYTPGRRHVGSRRHPASGRAPRSPYSMGRRLPH
jgi:hypothetical protein